MCTGVHVSAELLQAGVFQANALPLAPLDAFSDLLGCLAQLGLLVGINGLPHASAADSAMSAFETGMQ